MSGELRDGSYVWHITDPKIIDKIGSIGPGERLDSEIFEISGAKWFLRLFPNGTKSKYEGRVSLFLQLCSMATNTIKLKIKLILSCDETNTQYSDIKNFSEEREFGGWTGGILKTNQLTKHKKLTFRVNIFVIAREMYPSHPHTPQNGPHHGGHAQHGQHHHVIVPGNDLIPSLTHLSSTNSNSIHRRAHSLHPKANTFRAENVGVGVVDDFNPLESIEIRINSLSLNVMHLTQSIKQIGESLQMINTKMDNYDNHKLSQQRQQQLLQHQSYNMKHLKKDIFKIKQKLGINDNNGNDDELENSYSDDGDDSINSQLKLWFINDVRLPDYYDIFVENGLEDMSIITALSENELKLIGVTKIGHRIKIMQEIEKYKQRNINNHHHHHHHQGDITDHDVVEEDVTHYDPSSNRDDNILIADDKDEDESKVNDITQTTDHE